MEFHTNTRLRQADGKLRRSSGPDGTDNFRSPALRPAYFVRKTTLKFARKSPQYMRVQIGSDEIFSSVFCARSFGGQLSLELFL